MSPTQSIRLPGSEEYNFENGVCYYDYLSNDGFIFSCNGKDVEECRLKKNKWQINRILEPEQPETDEYGFMD